MTMTSDTTAENIDRTMTGLKDGIASATAGMEQAQHVLRDSVQKAIKSTEEMVAFSQGNIEALTRSGQIFATGIQDISQTVAAAAKSSIEDTMNTFKAMGSVKSFKEMIDLQSNLVRTAMERAVAQTGQLTEHSMKLSERTFAPISARLALATDKFGRVG